MSAEKRVSIGVDEVTRELLRKLEKVTGIKQREHLRRAVERYFNDAPQLFTATVVEALAQQPTTLTERTRLDNVQSIDVNRGPILRKKDGA